MPHRRKPVEMNVVEMLDSTRHGLQVLYPSQFAAIDGMIDTIKNLLTEEDKKRLREKAKQYSKIMR